MLGEDEPIEVDTDDEVSTDYEEESVIRYGPRGVAVVSQRDSGYDRKPFDRYETPAWVTAALSPHIKKLAHHVWEPAAGSGVMAEALRGAGYRVYATDIESGVDFLKTEALPDLVQCVCTSPPYNLAREFIEHSLRLTRPVGGVVAMLLRTDYEPTQLAADTCLLSVRHSRRRWCSPNASSGLNDLRPDAPPRSELSALIHPSSRFYA
jgi:hypothetical protein